MPKQNLNGWLILDKPVEMTSTQAVGAVKRLTQAKKVGHGGTLDPLATGVLPIALGVATKTMSFVTESEKGYRFTIRWGEERDTCDGEGDVVCRSDKRPAEGEIRQALDGYIGLIEQVPPAYSAIKINGQRAYDLARRGETPDIPPREVEIHTFQLLSIISPDEAEFEVTCGKGTYIRALARDLGRQLGCYGYVSALRRTNVGNFDEKAAISLDKLEELVHNAPPGAYLQPVWASLDGIPAIEVAPNLTRRLRNGQSIRIMDSKRLPSPEEQLHPRTVCTISEGKLIAVGEMRHNVFKPQKVFVY